MVHNSPLRGTFHLPASKSESNRALILQALAGAGDIANLSDAHDTQLLARLLALPPDTAEYDCEDAGTTLRFLTALLAVRNRRCVITGTARMRERPIGPLVDALRELGADISYVRAEGYPPLRLNGFAYSGRAALNVRADVSSQFVSALLLVAPTLPDGLFIHLVGEVGSAPYLRLTAYTLRAWGARVEVEAHAVRVWPGAVVAPEVYTVEADWSAASYAYALAALAPPDSELFLPNLTAFSPQGDHRVAAWAEDWGVETWYTETGVLLRTRNNPPLAPPPTAYDFSACPDLAPTVAVLLAALSRPATLTGLRSLRVKETDRIAALQAELARFGAALTEAAPEVFELLPGHFQVNGQYVRTYADHRMAMAFAPLALHGPLTIEAPEVVRKSFPAFWEELAGLGIRLGVPDAER